MKSPILDENTLTKGDLQTVFWQQREDDIAEAALILRTFTGSSLLSLMQEGREVIINAETVPELCRRLKVYAAHATEGTK